jgi:hypothetical protein
MASSAPEPPEGTPPPEIPVLDREFDSTLDLYRYLLQRLWVTGRFWLLPVLVLIFILGFFLNLFTGLNVLPAIYSLVP